MDWKLVAVKPDGRTRERAQHIEFFPSGRDNIYSSAMRSNPFGGRRPLDPMQGHPYVWAYIQGDTLTVNALLIHDLGGYEILTYTAEPGPWSRAACG